MTGATGQPGAAATLKASEEGDRAGNHATLCRRCLCHLQPTAHGKQHPRELPKQHHRPDGTDRQPPGHSQFFRQLCHLRHLR